MNGNGQSTKARATTGAQTPKAIPAAERTPAGVALDNLIRRTLKVGNPTDPSEIAAALGRRYPAEQAKLERETAGLPFVTTAPVVPAATPTGSASAEVEQALDDIDRDLRALTTDATLKDVWPELRGWSATIRSLVSDGLGAATLALDPLERNKAFGCRRSLGDYARLSRYVGVLTPEANEQYRSLAQSIDEVTGLIMVLMGDSLGSIGFGGGRFLLQVRAGDLLQRRDAAVHALRNLVGSSQTAHGPDDWPYGVEAYRQLVDKVSATGHADVLTLLQENHLTQLLDDLVERASNPTADSLRGVGATAPAQLAQIRRLLQLGNLLVSPESPALTSFFVSLQLFTDAFDDARAPSGFRLLHLSRPPILFYGLYGAGGFDERPTEQLLDIIRLRGQLAQSLDCVMCTGVDRNAVASQIVLDKLLDSVDRAIDLYSQGSNAEGRGEPEWRATAYAFVLDSPEAQAATAGPDRADLNRIRNRLVDALRWRTFFVGRGNPPVVDLRDSNNNPHQVPGFGSDPANPNPANVVAVHQLGAAVTIVENAIRALELGPPRRRISRPPDLSEHRDGLAAMHRELCLQIDSERQWSSLLQAMAPSCLRGGNVLGIVRQMLSNAKAAIGGPDNQPCEQLRAITLPPTVETTLDSLNIPALLRTGKHRPVP